MAKSIPESFIFMKVGNHAGETFEQILERKRRETKVAGRTFWGYGGTTLHPINQVQPFARLTIKEHGSISLVMQPMKSFAAPDILPAKEFSVDGIKWRSIPDGICVTGSRYALILDEIGENDLEISLDQYQVGIGRSEGRVAEEYIRGHVDKGCFTLRKDIAPKPDAVKVRIGYQARLIEPYAVLLR